MNDKELLESYKRMYLWIQEKAKENKYFDEEDIVSDLETLENMYPELLVLVEDLISSLESVVNKNERDKWTSFIKQVDKKIEK
jgi:hypothetical protein